MRGYVMTERGKIVLVAIIVIILIVAAIIIAFSSASGAPPEQDGETPSAAAPNISETPPASGATDSPPPETTSPPVGDTEPPEQTQTPPQSESPPPQQSETPPPQQSEEPGQNSDSPPEQVTPAQNSTGAKMDGDRLSFIFSPDSPAALGSDAGDMLDFFLTIPDHLPNYKLVAETPKVSSKNSKALLNMLTDELNKRGVKSTQVEHVVSPPEASGDSFEVSLYFVLVNVK